MKTKTLAILALMLLNTGCASQYFHPIKKTTEFYDDLGYCEAQVEREGMTLIGASRDRAMEQCLVHLGWRDKENHCFSRRLQTRMPASEVCPK
jgi:hypothetical protein